MGPNLSIPGKTTKSLLYYDYLCTGFKVALEDTTKFELILRKKFRGF